LELEVKYGKYKIRCTHKGEEAYCEVLRDDEVIGSYTAKVTDKEFIVTPDNRLKEEMDKDENLRNLLKDLISR